MVWGFYSQTAPMKLMARSLSTHGVPFPPPHQQQVLRCQEASSLVLIKIQRLTRCRVSFLEPRGCSAKGYSWHGTISRALIHCLLSPVNIQHISCVVSRSEAGRAHQPRKTISFPLLQRIHCSLLDCCTRAISPIQVRLCRKCVAEGKYSA